MFIIISDVCKCFKMLEEYFELGSGFNIVMCDFDIWGVGNLLGGEQSGFIVDIGYEIYQKIFEEVIQELKENEFKELFKEEFDKNWQYVWEVQIDIDVEMFIFDEYISSIQECFNFYMQLDGLEMEEEL